MVNFNFEGIDHYYYLNKVAEGLSNIIKFNHYDPIRISSDGNFIYGFISKDYVHNKYGDNRKLLLIISSKNVITCSKSYKSDIQSFYLFDKRKLLNINGIEKDILDLHAYFFRDKKDNEERRGLIENGIGDLHFQLLLRYIKDQYDKLSINNDIYLPFSNSIYKFTIDKEYLNFSPLNY